MHIENTEISCNGEKTMDIDEKKFIVIYKLIESGLITECIYVHYLRK